VLALKNLQSILTFAPVGKVSDPVIPGKLYHCSYTAIVYRVAETVVEKLRKLYQPKHRTPGDRYSLYLTVASGWARTLPLHVLIGDKYLIQILQLDPLSFLFFVEKDTVEADFAIRAIKFTFRSDGPCKTTRKILDEKNTVLKHANPTGQFAKALTMRFPDGAPMRTTEGTLRKAFIQVIFLMFSEYPLYYKHTSAVPEHVCATNIQCHKTTPNPFLF